MAASNALRKALRKSLEPLDGSSELVVQPLWNIWKSVGMMTFPIYGKIKHVPNHQPDNDRMCAGIVAPDSYCLLLLAYLWISEYLTHSMHNILLAISHLQLSLNTRKTVGNPYVLDEHHGFRPRSSLNPEVLTSLYCMAISRFKLHEPLTLGALNGKACFIADSRISNQSWMVVLTILENMEVNGKDYFIYYGK